MEGSLNHPGAFGCQIGRERYLIFEYIKKRPYHFGMTSEFFMLYMIEPSNPQKRRCASMKNEGFEFFIQNPLNIT